MDMKAHYIDGAMHVATENDRTACACAGAEKAG